ncbi:DMT family transporter [Sphingopyxis panaciterrulae]|uniref:Drug/metabolite transporter (DMT)-like permease n=1 Tax=Sphingopyxis panaciterrulae TaxID=462372 RepID=A0A7W9B1W6_9SPHN|nr:DMT family transporter [Sphingopyxis panaciterrulae]MBB5704711.1 drug/metabolite transporter (DMT)-like permease [Sphingopyxis panaciterrulae]
MTAKTDGTGGIGGAAARRAGWVFAALLGGNIVLAVGAPLVRLADTGPIATGFWRMAIALPFLALLGWREMGGRMPPRAAIGVAMAAGLFFALDLAAWHMGIVRTKVANATLFGNCASLLLVLWGIFLARTLPRGWQALAVLLAFAGAALLMGQSYELAPAYLVGDLFSLLAGVFYTFYVILMQRVRGGLGAWTTLGLSSAATLPVLLGAAVALGEVVMPVDWTPLVALALSSQVVGQGLLIWALPRFSPLVIGLTLLVQPAIAALAGWLMFGERLGAIDLAGGLMVGAALVLIRLPSRRQRPI